MTRVAHTLKGLDNIVIVGEQNPYGGDPYFALYPSPDGCSGDRLCRKIMGISRGRYLSYFARVNLCDGTFSLRAAERRASEIAKEAKKLVLCGSKVCLSFGVRFEPFHILPVGNEGTMALVLPHPSGRNIMWEQRGIIERARKAMREFFGDELCRAIDLPTLTSKVS